MLSCAGGKGKAVSGSVIRATIPYVKADIPILVLFRALGTVVSVWGCALAPRLLFHSCLVTQLLPLVVKVTTVSGTMTATCHVLAATV